MGAPVLGARTTLATSSKREWARRPRDSGPALSARATLAAILTNLAQGDVLFTTRSTAKHAIAEVALPRHGDYKLDIIIGKGPAPGPSAGLNAIYIGWAPPRAPGS